MAARWKLNPRETGLSAVGAGPRASQLYDDGKAVATVEPLGGDWRGPLRGWYWYGMGCNTCDTPAATVDEAKAQAMAFYKTRKAGMV